LSFPAAVAQTSPPVKVMRYAVTMMKRYDTNNDGILQREEWEKMPGAPKRIDLDGDDQITQDELVWFLTQEGRGRTIHRTVVIDLSEPYRFNPKKMQFFTPVLKREEPQVDETETEKTPEESIETIMDANAQLVDDEEAYLRLLEERQISTLRPYHVMPENLRGVPAWFIILDKNGDGQISLAEFAVPTLTPAKWEMFKRFDKNGNGFIEPDEVRNP
jgi:Ca2+-binding EF-hand superfamily protein